MKAMSLSTDPVTLRRIAEERFESEGGGQPANPRAGSPEFELRIHQVELEMQNEALREANFELQRSRDKYRELYDLSPVPYLTLSGPGIVTTANASAGRLLGLSPERLRSVPLASFLSPDQAEKFEAHRRAALSGLQTSSVDLTITSRDRTRHEVTLESTRTTADGGEWRTAIIDRSGTGLMNPALVGADGARFPLTALELQWSTGGWSFTAVVKNAVAVKISALGLFGIVRPVAIENVHVTPTKTSFAGRLREPEPLLPSTIPPPSVPSI